MLQVNVARLHEDNREALSLAWVAGREGGTAVRREAAAAAELIGHLNLTHPNSIQVIGAYEAGIVAGFVERLFESAPAAVIVADGVAPPQPLIDAAARTRTPLFTSPLPAPRVIEKLARYLAKALAETVERHGVLMDVLGLGVLITGESGVGKSELGLELISRGHGLVADDVVQLSRIAANALEGRCPPMLKDFEHPHHLRRDRSAPQDEAQAHRASGEACAWRGRPVRAPAARRIVRGNSRRHGAQSDHPGGRRAQPRGAGRGRGA